MKTKLQPLPQLEWENTKVYKMIEAFFFKKKKKN